MTETLALLQSFYGERLAITLKHQVGARSIGTYDINNTYQYIVNRDEVQLTWLAKAIEELGGTVTDQADPSRPVSGNALEAARQIIEEDARDAHAFVEKWRPRVEAMQQARHRSMLRVVLGEVLEQKRFFEQALAGRTDLLGRRGEAAGKLTGLVLSTRWVE